MQFDDKGIRGTDVSFYQGFPPRDPVINFERMKAAGVRFTIIKASQGNWSDPAFQFNWPAVKDVLPAHTYHFFDNRFHPKLQAEVYWNTVKIRPDGMFWLDLEDRRAGDYKDFDAWFNFIEHLKRISQGVITDERIGIYTALWYWRENTLTATPAELAYFKKFPLWYANYGEVGSNPLDPKFSDMVVPKPWTDGDCLIVQTGTPVKGKECGVASEEIDWNFFNGPEWVFNQFFKPTGGEIIIPPPTQGDNMIGKVITAALNIRPRPAVEINVNPIGRILANDIVEASEEVGGWWKLTKITRGTQAIALPAAECYAYEGATNSYIQDITPPPVPSEEYILHVKDGVTRKFVPSNE